MRPRKYLPLGQSRQLIGAPSRRGDEITLALEFYQAKASPKIGLTPLIDVVFILLLFFMLASNFNRWQQTPVAATSNSGSALLSASTINLELHPDSRLQLEAGQVFAANDWTWLAALISDDAIFTLTPVGKVSVQTLIDTVDKLQQRGVSQLVFGQE